jgi:hypothetical protein
MGIDVRRSWHCGYLPPDEWTEHDGPNMPPIRGKRPTPQLSEDKSVARFQFETDVCPGWICRQSAMNQAVEACTAMEAGELDVFFPGRGNAILQAAILMKSSFARYSNERAENSTRERELEELEE